MSQEKPPSVQPMQNLIDQIVAAIKPLLASVVAAATGGGKSSDRDVEHRMYEQATLASAHYALANMVTARAIRSQKYGSAGRLDLIEYALDFAKLDGFFAEFGVFQGETLTFVANRTDKVVYGFDSFEGLPEDWFLTVKKGSFSLQGELPKLAVAQQNYRLVKGWFNESLPTFTAQVDGPAAFLHIDCDLYESTKAVFAGLTDRIVAGTVIVFDEYFNYPGWQNHEFKAFQEFCSVHGVKYRYLAFAPMMFSVAVIIDEVGGSR